MRFKSTTLLLITLFISTALIISCDDDDSPYNPLYPLPDSGNTVEFELGIQIVDNDISNSYVNVKVLEQGSQLLNSEVFFDREALEYSSVNEGFFKRFNPHLLTGTLHTMRVRDQGWGEDSTLIRIPGDFEYSNLATQDSLHFGESRTFSWTDSDHAEFYRITIAKIAETTEYEIYDSLNTNEFTWTAPDSGFEEAVVHLEAIIKYSDDDVFSGETRCSLFGQFELRE